MLSCRSFPLNLLMSGLEEYMYLAISAQLALLKSRNRKEEIHKQFQTSSILHVEQIICELNKKLISV